MNCQAAQIGGRRFPERLAEGGAALPGREAARLRGHVPGVVPARQVRLPALPPERATR